jgi:hypothetical protein
MEEEEKRRRRRRRKRIRKRHNSCDYLLFTELLSVQLAQS